MIRSKKLLIGLAVVFVLVAGIMTYSSVFFNRPTQGPRIPKYAEPKPALLVIDIQEDYTGTTAEKPFPVKNAGPFIASVNRVIGRAAVDKMLVIYIRQEFSESARYFPGAAAIRGTRGARLDQRVLKVSDHELTKTVGDAFSNPALSALLAENQVNALYLVGLDGEYCVHNTARGALNRGYKVHIVTDAIALQRPEKFDVLLREYRSEGIGLITSDAFHP
ncbi:MAG: cysteine hydrolase family protein [Solirubrobacterales bacterium]